MHGKKEGKLGRKVDGWMEVGKVVLKWNARRY